MPVPPASKGGTPALLEKAAGLSQDTKGQITWGVNVYPFLGHSKQMYLLKILESFAVKIFVTMQL